MEAEEMFNELGYDYDESCDGILCEKYREIPLADKPIYEIEKIKFDKQFKMVIKTVSDGVFGMDKPACITFEELKAINKQIEELGG